MGSAGSSTMDPCRDKVRCAASISAAKRTEPQRVTISGLGTMHVSARPEFPCCTGDFGLRNCRRQLLAWVDEP